MVVDDLAQKSQWVRDFCADAHIFQVPFETCWDEKQTWRNNWMPPGLVPTGPGRVINTEWVRPPFDRFVLIGPRQNSVGLLSLEATVVTPQVRNDRMAELIPLADDAEYIVKAKLIGGLMGGGIASIPMYGQIRRSEGFVLGTNWSVVVSYGLQIGDPDSPYAAECRDASAKINGPISDSVGRQALKAVVMLHVMSTTMVSGAAPTDRMKRELTRDVDRFIEKHGNACLAEWFGYNIHAAFSAIVAALSLLNCHNVTAADIIPIQPRASRRRGDPAPYRYKVLNVHQWQRQRRGEAAPDGEPIPVHWVRGHFKEYTLDRPLLGRYIGLFWWQPHLAGRNVKAFVDKQYVLAGEPS